jgi:hypothetical protein
LIFNGVGEVLMQMRRSLLLLLILSVCSVHLLYGQATRLDWRLHNVGKVRQVVTNMGAMNKAATNYGGLMMCEFPPNSDEEHLFQGGLWVGAVTPGGDTTVSVTQSHYKNEFYPTANKWDTIWTVGRGDTAQIPYWPNYIGLSDQDFVCRYSDDNLLNLENHIPLHVEVIQSSHAWSSPPVDEFIIWEYKIIPKQFALKDVYIAFWMHSSIGNAYTVNFIDEMTRYYRDQHLAVAQDVNGGEDGNAISPIGFKVISPNTANLRWSFRYYEHETMPTFDTAEYRSMSSGIIDEDRLDQPARAHIILGFGPFQLNVGDTLKVEMAELLGYGLKGMLNNAQYIDFLKTKGFRVPSPPPKPVVAVVSKSHGVTLNWEQSKLKTETFMDPNRGDTIKYPFEGYRVYKSTKSKNGPWTLIAEYDTINDIGANIGKKYLYEDNGLLNNVEYYYAVTAYSRPDLVINFPSQETSTSAAAITVTPGTTPPKTVGEVSVVPNPYRGDVAYNTYDPPWEKPPGSRSRWMEQDRRIQFTNLPERCQINIYTLAGDLVYTIDHADPNKGYEDWNLTSSVGQAIASGIYLFSVEDKSGGKVQVGKFVIIK